LAPKTVQEQHEWVRKRKFLSHFPPGLIDPNKALVIDDQLPAIGDSPNFVVSKKFLKFARESTHMDAQRSKNYAMY
jgi:hypothetical protein